MHDIFISCSSKDKTLADALCAKLESEHVRCWIAPRDIIPGKGYAGQITIAIRETKVLILILTSNSNLSSHVLKEVELAVRSGATIIPLRIEDIPLSDDLEYYLGNVHWLDALTPPLESHLNEVTRFAKLILAREKPEINDNQSNEPLEVLPQPLIANSIPGSGSKPITESKLAEPVKTTEVVFEEPGGSHTTLAPHSSIHPFSLPKRLSIGVGGVALVLVVIGFASGWFGKPASPEAPTKTVTIPAAAGPPTRTPIPPTPTEAYAIGSTMVSEVDGMTMVYVPAGEFQMGSPEGVGDDDEHPQHTVYLDAYWIDQTEVTNAMYAKCVDAGKCTPPTNTSSYTRTNYYGSSTYDNYPVVYLDWYQANAYCAWAGRQLPSEAQWEKAARGTDGRTYPWGNAQPDSALLNYYANNSDTTAVGRYPAGASPYGALDMAGNAWEWVADWYGDYPSVRVTNPTGPASGTKRVLRGGSWSSILSLLRSTNRYWAIPDLMYSYGSFRCALPIPATQTPTTSPASVLPTGNYTIVSTMVSEVDGMTMVYVPAGEFLMGSPEGVMSDGDEYPRHTVNLDAYWIDQTEVTNAMYAKCVDTGKCTPPADTASYTRNSYYGSSTYAEYPVLNVNWTQARDYCAWAGRQLPSEAQWEKAARGTDGWTYPWGNGPLAGNLLNFADKNAGSYWSDANINDGYADTSPVGSYPAGASPYGALDMAGNVWEWVADWYGGYPSGSVSNPTGLAKGAFHVLRGGSWISDEFDVRSARRYRFHPDFKISYYGFRCTLSLP